jgi:ElaB/YqjD/DUF883 family membrane-anchored ribosome-binding protein
MSLIKQLEAMIETWGELTEHEQRAVRERFELVLESVRMVRD